jgi:hypothetical protein
VNGRPACTTCLDGGYIARGGGPIETLQIELCPARCDAALYRAEHDPSKDAQERWTTWLTWKLGHCAMARNRLALELARLGRLDLVEKACPELSATWLAEQLAQERK